MELKQNHCLIFCVKLNSPKWLDKIKPVTIHINMLLTKTKSELKSFSGTNHNSEPSSLRDLFL